LNLDKAKNVGDAEHQRGFLTKYKFKIVSQKREIIVLPFLNKNDQRSFTILHSIFSLNV